jgi:hypothetical protein
VRAAEHACEGKSCQRVITLDTMSLTQLVVRGTRVYSLAPPPDGHYVRFSPPHRGLVSVSGCQTGHIEMYPNYIEHRVMDGVGLPFLRMFSILSSSPPLQTRSLLAFLTLSFLSFFVPLMVLLVILELVITFA